MATKTFQYLAPSGYASATCYLYDPVAKATVGTSYTPTEDAVSPAPTGKSWYEFDATEAFTSNLLILSHESGGIDITDGDVVFRDVVDVETTYYASGAGTSASAAGVSAGATSAVQPIVKYAGESSASGLYRINGTDQLNGDTISSISSNSIDVTGEVVVSNAAVAGSYTDEDGNTVAANKGVEFDLSGGVAGSLYRVSVSVGTAAGDTRVLQRDIVVD